MASRLLNSGDLKNYQAIGEDGVLVWQRAEAFRASIQSAEQLKDEDYSEYLAIPRFSADSQKVDWFIPFASEREDGEYHVVSWAAASLDEKRHAYETLNRVNEKFQHFGFNLETRALTSNDKLFAHFLTGTKNTKAVNPAIHFPDESCLFIVNGRPVITFWGFLNRNAQMQYDPFRFLYDKYLTLSKHDKINVTGENGAAGAASGAAGAAAAARSHKWCWLWLLLLLLLLPLLLYLLWWWFFARNLPLFSVVPDLLHGSLDPANSLVFTADEQKDTALNEDVEVTLDGKELTAVDNDTLIVDEDSHTLDNVALRDDTVHIADRDLSAADDAVIADDAVVDDAVADDAVVDDAVADDAVVDDAASDDAVVDDAATDDNVVDDAASDDTAADNNTADNAAADDGVNDPDANPGVTPPELADDDQDNANAKDDANAQDNANTPDGNANNQPAELSNDDLNSNDVSKLDGSWNVISNIVDRKTNKPIKLSYNFKDGKGTATITQRNGVKCTGDINGGLNGGVFSIDGGTQAKCTDGSRYDLPRVECKTGANGKSNCVSIYEKNGQTSTFPMIITR